VRDKVEIRDTLQTLERLEQALQDLENLVRRSAEEGVTDEDEERYAELVRQARILYGSVQDLVGTYIFVQFGQQRDAFQQILGIPELSRIFHPIDGRAIWFNCCGGAKSAVQQAIGKVEAEARREGALHPEAVARWRWLILCLEAMRHAVMWALLRLRGPVKWGIEKIEQSLAYRIVAIVGAIGSCVGLVVVILVLAGIVG